MFVLISFLNIETDRDLFLSFLTVFREFEMFGSGTNLIATIIGFGMSATFIIFVCSRLICGRIRRRAESSRQMLEISMNENNMEQPAEPGRRDGLDAGVVAAIPTVKFSQQGLGSIDDAECSICLGDYEEKQVLRILPGCGHNFHIACIDVWLRKHSTCPVCRLPIHHDSFITKYYIRSPLLPSSPDPHHHHSPRVLDHHLQHQADDDAEMSISEAR